MPCKIEEHHTPGWYTWYCCYCTDGPWSCKYVHKCNLCGHDRCPTHEYESIHACESHTIYSLDFPWLDNSNKAGKERPTSADLQQSEPLKLPLRTSRHKGSDIPVNSPTPHHSGQPCESSSTQDETTIDPEMLYDSPAASTTSCETDISQSSYTDTPLSVYGEMHAWVDTYATLLAERVLSKLRVTYDATSGNFTCTTNEETTASASPSLTFGLGGSDSQAASNTQADKRAHRGRKNDADSGEDSDSNDRRKRQKHSDSDSKGPSEPEKRFACVFIRYDFEKYVEWQSCRETGFPSVHRMKEHLYRQHRLFPCIRCHDTFDKEAKLDAHLRSTPICNTCTPPPPGWRVEGINDKKYFQLKSRIGLSSLDQVGKWEKVFKICFPEYSGPYPSAYYDSNEFKDKRLRTSSSEGSNQAFERCRRELPGRVASPLIALFRDQLLNATEKEADRLAKSMHTLESSITNIIKSAFDQIVSPPANTTESALVAVGSRANSNSTSANNIYQSSTIEGSAIESNNFSASTPTMMIPPLNLDHALIENMAIPTKHTGISPPIANPRCANPIVYRNPQGTSLESANYRSMPLTPYIPPNASQEPQRPYQCSMPQLPNFGTGMRVDLDVRDEPQTSRIPSLSLDEAWQAQLNNYGSSNHAYPAVQNSRQWRHENAIKGNQFLESATGDALLDVGNLFGLMIPFQTSDYMPENNLSQKSYEEVTGADTWTDDFLDQTGNEGEETPDRIDDFKF